MHAYVFIGPGSWGFTQDETATNLPPDDGPWSFFRNAQIPDDVPDRSVDDDAVCAGLSSRGFAVLPFNR